MIQTRYPGVFVDELATHARSIEGVSTSTADTAHHTPLERLVHAAEPWPRADAEYKYVSVRRYLAFVEHSLQEALQFAVFEPNGERLWSNVRAAVSDFLLNQWREGALLGTKPEDAFFVKCDRSTMTQHDLDNGRLVLLVGVATLRPAEFVVVRISVPTGSAPVEPPRS